MIQFDQWMFPDGEKHLQEWMNKVNVRIEGRLTYQMGKYQAATSYCSAKRVSVDVGAHVGLMSYWMAKDFDHVHAFEPVSAHRECFAFNVPAYNVTMHPVALGVVNDSVAIRTGPNSSGDSWVSGPGDIEMTVLDEFELEDVDFLKLDTEGHELPILMGGEKTLKRCRPVVMVEQKKGHAQRFGLPETGAVDYLKSLGYALRREMSGDYIMTPT